MMSIAGHLSPEMIRHYTHIRTKAKEAAVAKQQSYVPPEVRPKRKRPLGRSTNFHTSIETSIEMPFCPPKIMEFHRMSLRVDPRQVIAM